MGADTELGGAVRSRTYYMTRGIKMKHNVLEIALRALEDWYVEYGKGRSLEYAYGYMDALAVIRQMSEDAIAPVRDIGHPAE